MFHRPSGYWLKDPSSRIQESTGAPYDYGVDYRTERYRLEDLLKKTIAWLICTQFAIMKY